MVTPVGFWSYARQDDAHSDGHLSQLRVIIGKAIGLRYGGEVTLWQDVTAIPFGADWEKEIGRTVGQTTFFVPIVTPRFLRSTHCHQEYVAFRERMQALGRDDLVFPIHYVDIDDLEPADTVFGDDLTRLRGHQWIDFRTFLHTDPRAQEMRAQADVFARGILLTMRRVAEDERRAVEVRAREDAEHRAAEAKAKDEAERRSAEIKQRQDEAERRAAEAKAREESERQANAARAKDAERQAADAKEREEAKARDETARRVAEAKAAQAETKAPRESDREPAEAGSDTLSAGRGTATGQSTSGETRSPPASKTRRWLLAAGGGAVAAVAGVALVSRNREGSAPRAADAGGSTRVPADAGPTARANPPVPGDGLIRTFQGQPGWVYDVAFVPNSGTALSGTTDQVTLWKLDSAEVLHTFDGSSTPFAPAPDGQRIVCVVRDKNAYNNVLNVIDLSGREVLRRLPSSSGNAIDCVGITPDGRSTLAGTVEGEIDVFDILTGRHLRTLRGHTGPVDSVAVASSGKTAISGSLDKTVKLWDLATGRALRTFSERMNPVAFVDETTAISASVGDNNLVLFDLASGKIIRSFQGHTDEITSVAVSPDGSTAVSGSVDKTVKWWDLATGQGLRTFVGHTGNVDCVAIAPDGKTALSGSRDETLKLWDLTRV